MIPAGTRLTFDVQGTTGQYWVRTDETVRADAISQLMAYVNVESLSLSRPGLFDDPITFATGLHWPYTAVVRVVTKYAHAELEDINSIVRGSFAEAAGEYPTVTARDYQPAQDPALTTTGPDLGDVISAGGSWLGLVLVAAAGVAVFAWRKGG